MSLTKSNDAQFRVRIEDLERKMGHVNDEDYKDIQALKDRVTILESKPDPGWSLNERIGEIVDRELSERIKPWWRFCK